VITFEEPVECPCCGYPFGTVAPDECPGCNAEIVGVTRVSDTRFEYDRPVRKVAGELLRLHMKLGAAVGSRGIAAAPDDVLRLWGEAHAVGVLPTLLGVAGVQAGRDIAGYGMLMARRHEGER